jgi:hypothetical protein
VRDAITFAKNMRNNGASLQTIEARLRGCGFDAMAIKSVLAHIPSEEPKNTIVGRDESTGARMGLVFVGLMVVAAGVFFAVGNLSGVAPSLPYFGFAMMVLGESSCGSRGSDLPRRAQRPAPLACRFQGLSPAGTEARPAGGRRGRLGWPCPAGIRRSGTGLAGDASGRHSLRSRRGSPP